LHCPAFCKGFRSFLPFYDSRDPPVGLFASFHIYSFRSRRSFFFFALWFVKVPVLQQSLHSPFSIPVFRLHYVWISLLNVPFCPLRPLFPFSFFSFNRASPFFFRTPATPGIPSIPFPVSFARRLFLVFEKDLVWSNHLHDGRFVYFFLAPRLFDLS